jgi:hypothetical protein
MFELTNIDVLVFIVVWERILVEFDQLILIVGPMNRLPTWLNGATKELICK